MKTKILLEGLVCLSVVAVAQQSNTEQKPANADQQMVRESPSKTSPILHDGPSKPSNVKRESPSKGTPQVSASDVNGDGKADTNIGSQGSENAGTAINNSHSNIKSPRDAASGQASGKVNVQDLNVMKRTESPAPADPKK